MSDPADHAPTYALRDGDGWWYFLTPQHRRLGISIRITDEFGNDLERGHRQGWFYSPDPIAKILVHRERRGDIIRYRLRDEYRDRPEITLPETLSPDGYAGLALTDEDIDDLDPRGMPALYRAAYIGERDDPITEVETINLDGITVLEGRPPDAIPEGATWRANLPVELRERPEYRHLFPGRLEGIGQAIADRLSELDHVKAYYQSGGLKVFTTATGTTIDLVKDGTVPRPPRWIEGDNLEQAATKWRRRLDDYEQRVRQHGIPGDCWRCGGTGRSPNGGRDRRDALIGEVAERFRKAAGRSRAGRELARSFAEIAVDLLAPGPAFIIGEPRPDFSEDRSG